jgi:hypothetical protein
MSFDELGGIGFAESVGGSVAERLARLVSVCVSEVLSSMFSARVSPCLAALSESEDDAILEEETEFFQDGQQNNTSTLLTRVPPASQPFQDRSPEEPPTGPSPLPPYDPSLTYRVSHHDVHKHDLTPFAIPHGDT